ncbi:CDP-alcohol phosphatidyltransferase domain-containing protein [Trichoderma sp. SZMC 28014]
MLLSRALRPIQLPSRLAARPIASCRRCIWSAAPASSRSQPLRRDNPIVPYNSLVLKRLNHQAGSNTDKEVVEKQKSTAAVHEDIYTIPNFLTVTRIAASPVIGYLILQDANTWAVGLLAYAGLSDLVDGWIARRWNRRTVVGTIIDPMADKILMTILTVCLAVKGALPVWVASIILGRDVGLAISAIYWRWVSLPPPKTFSRYWDFSLPSAEVRPTTISKYNTFLQLALVGLTTAAPILSVDLAQTLTILQYIVATTTIWSGASYIFSKDAIKILNKP